MSRLKLHDVGDIYVDDAGELHSLIGYCDLPTMTLESVCTKYRSCGAIDSPLMDGFSTIDTLNKDQLIGLVKDLFEKLKSKSLTVDELKLVLADTKIKYADLRVLQADMKLAELKSGQIDI